MTNVNKPNRYYCFTINNYTATDIEQLTAFCGDCTYLTYGYEKGTEQNTPHIQGYFELPKPQRFSYVKKRLPRAHYEIRKGSRTQARDYCHKEDPKPFEYGIWKPDKQGMRNDLTCVKRKIDEGASEEVIADEHFNTWCRNYRAFERYRNLRNKRKCTVKTVIWLHGPTGSGKSKHAYSLAPDAYWKPPETKWFDGYTGESTVILDDFRYTWFSFSYLLRLLDRYPMSVENKGGSTPWIPHTIIVTCPNAPEDAYPYTGEDTGQLLRRITKVIKVEG